MERLDNLDIAAFIEETVERLKKLPLEHNTMFSRAVPNNYTGGSIREMLLSDVWGKCVSALNGTEGEGSVIIEKALAELMRNGLDKGKIDYRKDSFRFLLANEEYRAFKRGVGGDAYVCPWPCKYHADEKNRIMMSGERLAALLMLFDSKIPEMDGRIVEILKVLDQRKLELQKRNMERQIKRVVVQSLVDKYLEPLGLNVSFRLTEEGKVSMTLKRIYSAELEVSMEELADRLEDTEAILAQLKPAPTKREDFKDYLRII